MILDSRIVINPLYVDGCIKEDQSSPIESVVDYTEDAVLTRGLESIKEGF